MINLTTWLIWSYDQFDYLMTWSILPIDHLNNLIKIVIWSDYSFDQIGLLIKLFILSNCSFYQIGHLIKLVIWSNWLFDQIGHLIKKISDSFGISWTWVTDARKRCFSSEAVLILVRVGRVGWGRIDNKAKGRFQ